MSVREKEVLISGSVEQEWNIYAGCKMETTSIKTSRVVNITQLPTAPLLFL